jgi:hypothetical protein
MAPQIPAYEHSVTIRPILAHAEAGAFGAVLVRGTPAARALNRLADEIRTKVDQAEPGRPAATLLTYDTAAQLFARSHAQTDFFVHDLAGQYVAYGLTRPQLPMLIGMQAGIQNFTQRSQRLSGHITGTFAEAIAVWALEALGKVTSTSNVLRVAALEPPGIRYLTPDYYVLASNGTQYPCEVKHAAKFSYLHRDTITTAILQACSAMLSFQTATALLCFAIGDIPPSPRYRLELVTLG